MAEEKIKITYEPEIITLEESYEEPLDEDKIPVFTIENCEVLYSSLTSKNPQFGHNIQIMLPSDTDFVQKDRTMRTKFLQHAQIENPNLEVVKASVALFTQKDVLENKTTEKNVGRAHINFTISNAVMFDKTKDEDNKDKFKKISKVSEATGTPVVKYFRVIDKFTGKGIEPEVFKYVNGEKVKTFTNPKTKEESPLYIGGGDIVNIKIRPFCTKNKKDDSVALKYNILSIEIVQTAFDRGLGKTSGSSSRTQKTPDTITSKDLGSVFGDMFGETTAVKEPKKEEKKASKTSEKKVEVKEENSESGSVPEMDFSALANMNFDDLNLGE